MAAVTLDQAQAAAFSKEWIINYPDQAYPALSGVGTNTFDFKKQDKQITLYDGTIQSFQDSLTSLGFPYLKTLAIATDMAGFLQFWRRGQRTQRVGVDQFTILSGAIIPFDKLTVTFPYPAIYLFVGTTNEREWSTFALSNRMQRYSSGVTANSFAATQWQAMITAAVLSNPAAAYTTQQLYVPNCGRKALYIFNNGLTSMDVDLQGSNDGLQYVDDASTGASTTVTAGNSLALAVDVPYQFMQLRVRSTVAGVPAAYAATFIGNST